MAKKFFPVLVLLVLGGCNSQQEIGTVEVRPDPPNLEISNSLNSPVFFYAIENGTAARIRLEDPCMEFEPNLQANSTINFPYEDIMGYDEEAELLFFMWTNCNGASGSDTYPLYP